MNALVQAIPSIFNVLLVCLVFWLVFGIMGVTLFSGRFYSCEDSEQRLIDSALVPDKETCESLEHLNYSWNNPTVNFDSVPAAYLALFQVVGLKQLAFLNNCPAVAEMGDRLATIDMGRKEGGCCAPFLGSSVPIKHNVAWAEAYLRTKWYLDASSRSATIRGPKSGELLLPPFLRDSWVPI